jgi:hypothetical protein
VLGTSWADSGINALCVLHRLVRLRGVADSSSDGPCASRVVVRIEHAGADAEATIATCWGDSEREKRTVLRLRGGRVVELDHGAGVCAVDGIEQFSESAAPAQVRYDAMFRAHFDNRGLPHTAHEVEFLHRMLTAGTPTAERNSA